VNAPCDITGVRAGLAARVAKIAIALVGEPNRPLSSKSQLRFGRKGSLAVMTAGPKTGSWYDHENGIGGDLIDLVRHVHGCSFRDALAIAAELLDGNLTAQVKSARAPRDDCAESRRNQKRGFATWNEGISITGTAVVPYLASRGLELPQRIDGEVLRFHPQCPYGKVRHPCMVALMRNIHTNQPQAIHRTALTPAGMKIGRMALGPKTGAAVKLSADEIVSMGLTIGEGIETVLSAMQLGFSPAWALGDASNVRAFPVLSGVEGLTIIVDNDESSTGQRAALECSRRWTGAGRDVFRVIPDRRGSDINDVVQRLVA
jgi:hypothetical protein